MTALTNVPVIQASKVKESYEFNEKVSQVWFFFFKQGGGKFPIRTAIKNLQIQNYENIQINDWISEINYVILLKLNHYSQCE